MRDWSLTQIRCVVAIAAVLAVLSPPARAEERTVNFYNWSNYIAPGVLEDFTRKIGLRRRRSHRLFPAAPDQGECFPEARQVEAAEPRQRLAGGDETARRL